MIAKLQIQTEQGQQMEDLGIPSEIVPPATTDLNFRLGSVSSCYMMKGTMVLIIDGVEFPCEVDPVIYEEVLEEFNK